MAISVILSGYLGTLFGWRVTLSVVAIPAFLVALLIWRLLKETHASVKSHSEPESRMSFSEAIRNLDIVLISMASFCTNYIFWTLGTWSPAIFHDAIGGGLFIASVYDAIFGLSVAPGQVTWGILSDKSKKRRGRKPVFVLNYAPLSLSMVFLGVSMERFPQATLLLLFIGISAAVAAGS